MTGLPLNGKTVDLVQLAAELTTAGVLVPNGLGADSLTVYTYDGNGEPANFANMALAATVLAAHIPSTALHDALVTALTSAVGVALTTLTQAQRLALVAGLLYKAGAIDKQTLAVKPLSTWLL